jgi:hypothetical protein
VLPARLWNPAPDGEATTPWWWYRRLHLDADALLTATTNRLRRRYGVPPDSFDSRPSPDSVDSDDLDFDSDDLDLDPGGVLRWADDPELCAIGYAGDYTVGFTVGRSAVAARD